MQTQAARRLDEPAGGPGLEPETILPSQFFGRFQLDASLQPEKRLMLAVLEDAVGTFQKYVTSSTRRGQRLFAEAEEWFAAPATEWPFSFESICQALGLDAAYLGGGLRRWRDAQRAVMKCMIRSFVKSAQQSTHTSQRAQKITGSARRTAATHSSQAKAGRWNQNGKWKGAARTQ